MSGNSRFIIFISLFVCGTLLTSPAFSFEPPALTGPVVDQAGAIDPKDRAYLEEQIRQLKDHTGVQAQVLTLASLGGESIEQVGIDTAEKWKLGSAKEDNGIILIVAPTEKKVRIEVGQGLEGVIPDILAYQIIQQKMLPAFRSGAYGKGLIAAVGTIEALVSPETAQAVKKSLGERKEQKGLGGLGVFFIILIFIFMVLAGGGRGGRGGGRSFLLGALLGSMSGGGRRGGFGGGGWSGGGGGFSGGGASGGW